MTETSSSKPGQSVWQSNGLRCNILDFMTISEHARLRSICPNTHHDYHEHLKRYMGHASVYRGELNLKEIPAVGYSLISAGHRDFKNGDVAREMASLCNVFLKKPRNFLPLSKLSSPNAGAVPRLPLKPSRKPRTRIVFHVAFPHGFPFHRLEPKFRNGRLYGGGWLPKIPIRVEHLFLCPSTDSKAASGAQKPDKSDGTDGDHDVKHRTPSDQVHNAIEDSDQAETQNTEEFLFGVDEDGVERASAPWHTLSWQRRSRRRT